MNKDNTFQYVRQIMLATVCSVVICATIAAIVVTQTRKDYATLEHVEESLALARSSLANAIQQEAKTTDEKITTLSAKIVALQKAIESLEIPQRSTTAESTQTDETFHPDSVPCCGGDEQINSSESASAQNADEGLIKEEMAELMTEAMGEMENDAAEADLFRSMLDEEELIILAEKTTRIQADIEETFAPILELIPGPYSEEDRKYMGFINAIFANIAESEAMMEMQIEQDEQEMAAPLEERMRLIPPENLTEEEMEEFENIQRETRQFMRMLEEAARQQE